MRALPFVAAAMALSVLAIAYARAETVNFNLSYSDPASDVVKLYSSNMTEVRLADGTLVMSPFPDAVNILRLGSAEAGLNVSVSLEVKGTVANAPNTTYEFRLYTRSDNASHFIVRYVNGITTLSSNATGFQPRNITGNSTISAAGTNPTLLNKLTINVAKVLLGNVTAWNLDATAIQVGPEYSYRDFGWELPGNPGSTPTQPTESPFGFLTNWAWVILGVVLIATVLAVLLLALRRRKPTRKA